MNYKNTNIITIIKGIIIGGTMLVPGVSGGSMAMILGIYNRLISGVSSFTKNIKENLIFFILFISGAGIGMIIFAKPLLSLIEAYPKPTLFTILGIVAGGLPMIYKETKITSFSFQQGIYILIGLISVIAFGFIPESFVTFSEADGLFNLLFLFLTGFIAAIALVLPGISVSYLLLLMGLYDTTMTAISNIDLTFLIPMALGVFLGILAITGILEKAMSIYPQPTYLIIIGFVLGSMTTAFPGKPSDFEWFICLPLFLAGFLLMYKLQDIEHKL